MSKRDIETVCTLAAHLAQEGVYDNAGINVIPQAPERCAADAMTLQRLARNIRGKARRIEYVPWGTYLRTMTDKTEAVLRPYGLEAHVWSMGITVLGLPGNTGGHGFDI